MADPDKFGWRPIKTAPKDGGYILLWNQPWEKPSIACWIEKPHVGKAYWAVSLSDQEVDYATHWQPLPYPPEAA